MALARTWWITLLFVTASLAPLPALGADEGQAKVYFEAGRQAYESGRYAVAASAFEEAYRLSPKPQVLFSLAQAHRQQFLTAGEPARLLRAVELFRRYLAEVTKGGRHDHAKQHLADLEPQLARIDPTGALAGGKGAEAAKLRLESKTQLLITAQSPGVFAAFEGEEDAVELPQTRDVAPGRYRVHAEAPGYIPRDIDAVAVDGRLIVVDATLAPQPATIRVNAPEGATIVLDGRLVGTAPLSAELEVPAGRHLVVVTERGSYGYSRELTLERGEARTLDVVLEATTQRTISYFFLAGSSAILAAGAVTGFVALRAESRASEIDDRRTARQGLTAADLEDYGSAVARRDKAAPASFGLLGAGAAIGLAGALLYLIDSPRVEVDRGGGSTGARAGLTPIISPDGAGIAWGGSF